MKSTQFIELLMMWRGAQITIRPQLLMAIKIKSASIEKDDKNINQVNINYTEPKKFEYKLGKYKLLYTEPKKIYLSTRSGFCHRLSVQRPSVRGPEIKPNINSHMLTYALIQEKCNCRFRISQTFLSLIRFIEKIYFITNIYLLGILNVSNSLYRFG